MEDTNDTDDYSAMQIQVLSSVEAVRKRPGMYVGDTRGDGLYHLLWEVIGNVIDLHLRRDATELHVDITEDSWVTIRDDGPGIPVCPVTTGESVLECVLTKLHAGATYDGHYPHVHICPGLVGVGLVVVNALSRRLEVETTVDGTRWAMRFERGVPTSPLRRLGPTSIDGTLIRFQPDPSIFESTELDVERVRARLQQLAWLNPFLGIWFQERTLKARGGVRRWAESLAASRGDVLARYSTCQNRDGVYVDLALAWTNGDDLDVRCFVNANETRSGTHVAGMWRGLARVARTLGAPDRPAENARKVLGRGLVAIVHVGLFGPQFASPTRDHLASPIAGTAVAGVLASDLPEALARDVGLGTFVRDRLGIALRA